MKAKGTTVACANTVASHIYSHGPGPGRAYSPQQEVFVLHFISIDNIMSFNIDVGVVINDH